MNEDVGTFAEKRLRRMFLESEEGLKIFLEAEEGLRMFLESTPPNIPVCIPGLVKEPQSDFNSGSTHWTVDNVAPHLLQLHCDVDDGIRRFDASEENSPGHGFRFLEYVCRDCCQSKKTYALVTEAKRVAGRGRAHSSNRAR